MLGEWAAVTLRLQEKVGYFPCFAVGGDEVALKTQSLSLVALVIKRV